MIQGIVSRLFVMLAVTSMILSGCTTGGVRFPAGVSARSVNSQTVNRGENSVVSKRIDTSKAPDKNTAAGATKIARRDEPQEKLKKIPSTELGNEVEAIEREIIRAEDRKKPAEAARLTRQLSEILAKDTNHQNKMNRLMNRERASTKISKASLKAGEGPSFNKALPVEPITENDKVRLIDNRVRAKKNNKSYGSNRDAARISPGQNSRALAGIPSRKLDRKEAEGLVAKYKMSHIMDDMTPNRFVETDKVTASSGKPFADIENQSLPIYRRKEGGNRATPNTVVKKPETKSGASTQGGWDDYYEPNDYRSSAYSLETDAGYWLSSIDGSGYQWDDDYYEIYLRAGARVTVDLRFLHYEGDIDLQLQNSNGSTIASSGGTSDDEYIDTTVSSSGYYYIRVYYGDDGNSYDLKWTTSGGTQSDDEYEQNDYRSSAYSLISWENDWLSSIDGWGVAADDDYYKINVGQSYRRVVVDLRFDHYSNGGDIDVQLQNSSGSTICSSASTDDDEYLDCQVPSGGDYYIRVFNYGYCSLTSSTSPCNYYDMKWYSIQTGGVAEDIYEPNDTLSYANTSAFPYSGDRSIYNLAQWDEDWYKIPISANNRLIRIEADFSDYEGDIDIQLRSPSGAELISSMSTDNDELIDYNVPSQYTYVYLRVFGDNAGNRYSLRLTQAETEDTYEENDSLAYMSPRSNLSNREGTWLSNIYGRARQADADYYFIGQPTALGRFMIDARFTHAEGDIDIQLLDQEGRVIANSIGIENDEYIDTAVRPGMNYTIRVYGDNRGNSYDLKWNAYYSNNRWRHAFSTNYYNPTSSGQGLSVAYVDGRGPNGGGEDVLVGWFTFNPSNPGQTYWMNAVGPVRGNRGDLQVYVTRGGVFDNCRPGYVTPTGGCSTPTSIIGTASLEITGCNTATFSYDIVPPGGARQVGTMNVHNFGMDRVAGRDVCTGLVVGANNPIPPSNTPSIAHEGLWYEPRTSGQGFFLDSLETGSGPKPFMGWYTYQPSPQIDVHHWMTVQPYGTTPGGVAALSTGTGRGRFMAPPALNISDYEIVGQGVFEVFNCNSARLSFSNFNLGSSGPLTIDLSRLSPAGYFEYMNGNQYVKVPYCQ